MTNLNLSTLFPDTFQIVVARYKEDVSWTKPFSNVVIYDKSGDSFPTTSHPTIYLPNIGREGHTFYKHIVDNYDSLPPYICFLQGHPFDHFPRLLAVLYFIRCTRGKCLENRSFVPLSKCLISCTLNGCKYHPRLPLKQVYNTLFANEKNRYPPASILFGPGGQFIVSRQRILARPKPFYQQIVKMLEHSVNPIEGYVIERFHYLIFTTKSQNQRHEGNSSDHQTHRKHVMGKSTH